MGTPLNVAILMSRVRVEEKLLLTELEKRGVSIQRIDDREIKLDIDRPNLECDVVLERAVNHLRALYALRIYNDWRIPTVNTYDVANTCGDKLLTTAALMRHQVPSPRTIIAFTPEAALEAIEELGYRPHWAARQLKTGVVPIIGTATDAHMGGWTVQYSGGDSHGWVTIGSGNQLNNSSINVGNIGNTTVASSARSEADQFVGTLTQQYQQLDQVRKQEHSLKMQAAGMGLYAPPYVLNELESAEQKIIDLLQELIDKRGDWAQQLGRRAAGDPELPKLLAEATAETAELALDLKGRQLQRLKKRYEIQPSDSGRRQVQGQINALTAEIAELRRQRDAAQ